MKLLHLIRSWLAYRAETAAYKRKLEERRLSHAQTHDLVAARRARIHAALEASR